MKTLLKATPKFNQKFKLLKIASLTSTIVMISILLGSFQSEAVSHRYIETQVSPKDISFYINDIKGEYAFISTHDTIETGEDEITLTLNNISSVKILPYSQLQFLQLGNKPSIKLIKGEVEIQTIGAANIFSHNNKATIKQGGLKISHKENYSEFGNYYGNTNININNSEGESIISYALPVLKKISIFKDSNKSNWGNIRYSKLNKELRFNEFKEKVVRKAFSPDNNILYSQFSSASFLQETMTVTPKKLNIIEKKRLFEKIDKLKKAIKAKSKAQVSNTINELSFWKNYPEIQNLQNIIAGINDPLIRYYVEVNLLNLFNEPQGSIDLEMKYFYTLWTEEQASSEQKLLEEVDKKIEKNKETLYVQEEYYNLINSLIEAYPSLVNHGIIRSKNNVERNLFKIVKTPTEKADIILSSYVKNLNIIKKLIKNNNGQLAKVIYDTMLINTQEYSNERIVAFRENNEDKESEVQDLLNFYQERLHSSAFNKNIFKEYQENKELEKEAVNIFKSSGEKVRTRPINHNFYSVSQELEKYSIYINTANINLVFAGSNELYIKEAELIPQTEYSFNFIYNPETKIISQVEWNSDIPMPSLNEHIPLKNFQESYNTLLNIELGTNEETEKAVIQDWSYEAEEMREIYNYEANIKKQLTKKELEKNKITSKHNYMDVLSDNTISIKNATLSFTREKEAKKDIHFDMELETGSWMVLHASFIEFPDANIAPSKLIDLSPLLIMSYQEEVEKNNIQNEAQKVFRSYNPDIQALDFTVTDKENGIVSFTNLPLFIEEEIWRVSGNYNSTTQVITEAQTEHKNEKIYLKEIKAHSLKNYLKDLNTETSKDVDDIILDSLLDENFFDEIDAEITEIQL